MCILFVLFFNTKVTKGQLLKLPKNHPKNRILTFFIFLIRIQILFLVLWYINTVRSLQTVKVEKNCHWIVTKTGTHSLIYELTLLFCNIESHKTKTKTHLNNHFCYGLNQTLSQSSVCIYSCRSLRFKSSH